MRDGNELRVFITASESTCHECQENLGRRAWILLTAERKGLCLSCADLDHLFFLPTGDAAVTRRARKYSTLWAVVLKWSRARGRYERQGLLVEEAALARAEEECAQDAGDRERRRERARERREVLDGEFVDRFGEAIASQFPGCPPETARAIAEHACRKHSGRVGRTAAARALDEKAVRLAVAAHVRHAETPYDALLMLGRERWEAREEVAATVRAVMDRWAQVPASSPPES